MKFKDAYCKALGNDQFVEEMRKLFEIGEKGYGTPCLLFSIGNESFYIGYTVTDGWKKGKHSAKRAQYLINTQQTLVIE